MLQSELFNCPNNVTYPAFKKGLYLEEYAFDKINTHTKRKYIPVKWTNFQIQGWFPSKKEEMQVLLDEWVSENPSNGYFTIVQYDDGPLLRLPPNTKVYGACSGDIPIPLIYEDHLHTLENSPRKSFAEKDILCSFVGKLTCSVRHEIFDYFLHNPNFKLIHSDHCPYVNHHLRDLFIETSQRSKFVLAPRGYGRSSFRFFECFQMGVIPIYVWDDKNWLPFQDIIDYKKLCVVIHYYEIVSLEEKLLSIDEDAYLKMLSYYEEIKHLFQMEGMTNQIVESVNSPDTYAIITSSIYNKEGVINFQHRENRYLECIKETLPMLTNIKPIIVENNGSRQTFLDGLNCDVVYTNHNELDIDKYKIEMMDIKEVIKQYNIQDEDMIIKITGRYKLLDSTFINTVAANKQYDAFIKNFNVCTRKFEENDCILGLFAMKGIYLKNFEYTIPSMSPEKQFALYTSELDTMRITHLGMECCFADNLRILVV